MEKPAINPSQKRLLLNAEPFGFGPSVAIASIFPHLREKFAYIGFVGKGHTLDVQRKLPYNTTYDISDLAPDTEEVHLKKLATQYDIFFTAMDFLLAKRMRSYGVEKTCRYDALAWYWPNMPEALGEDDLYLAQDFFGVKERLQAHAKHFSEAHVVPPVVPKKEPKEKGQHVLINLGGLQNPLWSLEEPTIYARKLIASLFTVVPANEKVIIATSQAVAERIGSPKLIYSREEMKGILARTKYAFMTPGLGNIYDSALYDIPTVWLPPANDSQGQQLNLLVQHGMADASVDWKDAGISINYRQNQHAALEQISAAVRHATLDTLIANLRHRHGTLRGKITSATSALLERFGIGGEERVANLVHQFAERSSQQHA